MVRDGLHRDHPRRGEEGGKGDAGGVGRGDEGGGERVACVEGY